MLARIFVVVFACLECSCSLEREHSLPYQNPKTPIDRRVEDLIARMTLEEKLNMLGGDGWMDTHANSRLGIPALRMADGPMGVRTWAAPSDPDTPETPREIKATAFPAGIA